MKKKRTTSGLLVAPDDLEVGTFVTVHSIKERPNRTLPFFGIAVQIKAINMPYVVVLPVGQTDAATLDIRYLNLMPVSDDFVKAQTPAPQVNNPQESPASLLGMILKHPNG
jgi:hypothetical protein